MPAGAGFERSMQDPLSCLACYPPELERLIRGEPAVAAQWQALPRTRFTAGAALQAAGQPSTSSWLIERGLVRAYYLSEQGIERNRAFHAQGAWVSGSLPPMGGVEPALAGTSPFTIEALEDTQTLELPHATLLAWHRQFPAVHGLLVQAMAYLFASQSRREAELLTLSHVERYQAFLKDQAALVERIPIHHVASYLGISQVSLSRIRARLGMANQGRA